MFILVKHQSGVCSVLDTDDGVVERVSLGQLRNHIMNGVQIVGVSIRPEFGEGQDMFFDFAYSRRCLNDQRYYLKQFGFDPSEYGL